MEIVSDAVKNLSRRMVRTVLAVLGVAVGVFSFLIMGSMAEHFSRIGRQFNNLFENRVFVVERPTFWAGGGILSQDKTPKVQAVPGVGEAIPVLIVRLRTRNLVTVGVPHVVIGVEPSKVNSVAGSFPLLSGSYDISTENSSLLGYDAAQELGVRTGDVFSLEDEQIKVTGILQKTGSLVDGQVFIPLPDAQRIYNREGLITSIFITPASGVNAEDLSKTIKDRVNGVEVIPSSAFQSQVKNSLALWNMLTLGAALVAAFAGALCVVIVMLASITERYVEIGIKKAIGATTFQVMMEFLTEASLISVFGWITGSIGAVVFTKLAGNWLQAQGSSLFELTARLIFMALGGAVILGALSGFYPAFRAARIKPVEALKVRY